MTNGAKRGGAGLLLVGIILGIMLWGGFNWAMEMTNTEEFCISCHEMKVNVYEELKDTVHFTNRTGIRATCPDCHVPKEWIHKVVRKIKASNELYHHFITKEIDTPEKFEAKRLHLAQNVWNTMRETNSRECRNCHHFASMNLDKQEERSAERHDPHVWEVMDGLDPTKTCIDCHKGIAHQLPAGYDPAEDMDASGS